MGKNKRRQGTWATLAASDDGTESLGKPARSSSRRNEKLKKRQNESSLKRKRSSKSGAVGSEALAQMLHDSFPRRQRTVQQDFYHGGEERFADFSDIVATDWQHRMPGRASDGDGDGDGDEDEDEDDGEDDGDDALYESQKLIMRQLVMTQLNYMRHQQQQQLDEDEPKEDEQRPSDADSWLEIEQSFAEIYEPLPYNVGMDSWRSMSKDEMLETITSRRLRAEMKYLSRAEILSQIQTMKTRHSKKQRGGGGGGGGGGSGSAIGKSPVYEDMSGNRTVLTPPPHAAGGEPPGAARQSSKKKEKKVKMISPEGHKSSSKKGFEMHTYQNTSAYRGQSLADIYQAKVEARRRELRIQKEAEQRARALYVTRAQIHAPPNEDEDDDASNASSGHQGFISRASILSKWGTTSTTPAETTKTKKELIEQFWRKTDYISTENVRSLNGQASGSSKEADGVYKNPAAFSSDGENCCSSNCEDCCDDNCSQCSCSSCASVGTVLPAKKPDDEHEPQSRTVAEVAQQPIAQEPAEIKAPAEQDKAPEPVPLSLVKQRKMEFERLRILEEQENRLKELVRQQRKTSATSNSNGNIPAATAAATAAAADAAAAAAQNQSWLDIAKKARQLEDKWHKARRTASSVVNPAQAMYEPVPASQVYQSNKDDGRAKRSSKSRKSRNRKRSKVLQQLRSRMRENLTSESLDPGVKQRRHMELQELLSDALHAGTQTLSNINLGLIYVPMEEQLEQEAAAETKKVDDAPSIRSLSLRGSPLTLVEQSPLEEPSPSARNNQENEDVFGSIDTLIFEPKAGGSSTLRTDEIDEMEKKIADEFDYLNDSQYGSCHEDGSSSPGTSKRSRSSAVSSSSASVSGSSCSTGSKNGRRAAVASVTAMPPQQFRYSTEGQTGSCAAAASCDASAFNPPSAPLSTASSSASLGSFKSAIREGKQLTGQLEKLSIKIPTPPPLPVEPLVPPLMESSDELATPRQTDVKSNRSTQLDSEAYTNVDTDASWDYYPEAGSGADRPLVVGNLRKRPAAEARHFESEADATARLLQSLRVAEETNASTSIRLIFPSESSKFAVPSVKDAFAILSDRKGSPSPSPSYARHSSRSPSVQSPDSGFRSLPAEIPPESSPSPRQGQPDGPRKRDTMIRELKSRLMDKLPCVGDDRNSSAPPSLRRHPSDGKKKAKVVSKLESLLATFNTFAEMKAEGRVYRTYVPNELSIEHEALISDIDYESIQFVAPSAGYPQHAANIYQRLQHPDGFSEPASTIYNPSLPDEFIPLYNQLDPARFDGDQFIDFDSRYPFDDFLFPAEQSEDPLCHEGLYSICDPLEERSSSSGAENERARKHRRRRKKRPRPDEGAAWSDAENQIFAEGVTDDEALLLRHQVTDPAAVHHPSKPSRRMAQYHDDWLFWDQMHSWFQLDADRERWEKERARRMLLWMHHVQQNCEAAGLPMPAWWQV